MTRNASWRIAALAVGIGAAVGIVRLGRIQGRAGGGAVPVGCGGPPPQEGAGATGASPAATTARTTAHAAARPRTAAERRKYRKDWLVAHPFPEGYKHPFKSVASGFTLHAPQFGQVRVESDGVSLGGGIKSRFTGFGRAGQGQPIAAIAPVEGDCDGRRSLPADRCSHRVEYRYAANVTEWWLPALGGLEQGFDVSQAPAGGGELSFDIALDGATLITARNDGRSVEYQDAAGKRYGFGGLYARDADGKELPARMEVNGAAVRLVVNDSGARFPIVVDPIESSALWSYSPGHSGAQFGYALANAGNIDNTGTVDLVVGAPYDTTGGTDAGAIYEFDAADVVGINAGGKVVSITPFNSPSVVTGPAKALLGYSVAAAGDVNGDGVADLIAGEPEYNDNHGRAYVWKGKSGGALAAGLGGAFWYGEGGTSAVAYGQAVAGGVDLDGDGYDDIIVGEPGWDGQNSDSSDTEDEGEAWVLNGGPSTMTTHNFYNSSFKSNSLAANYYYNTKYIYGAYCGSSVALLTGGGMGVGCPDGAGSSSYTGWVLLYTDSGLSAADPGYATYDHWGDASHSGGLGRSMANAGDVNGDGYEDLIVGQPYYNGYNTNGGQAWLLFGGTGADTSADLYVQLAPVTTSGALCGTAVAGLGDVDGDGLDDFAVGCPGVGDVYVYYGKSQTSSNSATFTKVLAASGSASDLFGAAVAGGDFNNGGLSDLVVGAPAYSSSTGIVYQYANSIDYTTERATNVKITGTPTPGSTLTGSYSFSNDDTGLSESGSTYKWYTVSGTTLTAIGGATSKTYVPTTAQIGDSLEFCVTPADSAGTGPAACSGTTSVGGLVWYSGESQTGTATSETVSDGTCVNLSSLGLSGSTVKSLALYGSSSGSTIVMYTGSSCSGTSYTKAAGADTVHDINLDSAGIGTSLTSYKVSW